MLPLAAAIAAEMQALVPASKATPTNPEVISRLSELREKLGLGWSELEEMEMFNLECVRAARSEEHLAAAEAGQVAHVAKRRLQDEQQTEKDTASLEESPAAIDALENEQTSAQLAATQAQQAEREANDRAVVLTSLQTLREAASATPTGALVAELWAMKDAVSRLGELSEGFPAEITRELDRLVEQQRQKREAAAKKSKEEREEKAKRMQDLVLKVQKDGAINSTRLVLSTWDFGGQVVFSALYHLFLTPYGAYLLVFNMETLRKGISRISISGCVASTCMHRELTCFSSGHAPTKFIFGTSAPSE